MEKGNFTEYLEKFRELYSELLKQGRDLYVIDFSDSKWAVGLKKIEREQDDWKRLKITPEDAKELYILFSRWFNNENEIIQEYQIEPHTHNEEYQLLTPEGLEDILQGCASKVYQFRCDID